MPVPTASTSKGTLPACIATVGVVPETVAIANCGLLLRFGATHDIKRVSATAEFHFKLDMVDRSPPPPGSILTGLPRVIEVPEIVPIYN